MKDDEPKREHDVWAVPPGLKESILMCSYPLHRWQWALKYQRLLLDKGYTNVVILESDDTVYIDGEQEEEDEALEQAK